MSCKVASNRTVGRLGAGHTEHAVVAANTHFVAE